MKSYQATIDYKAMERVSAELELTQTVRVVLHHLPNKKLYGVFDPQKWIVHIYIDTQNTDAPTHVHHYQILHTILHELRHAHQWEHWDPEVRRLDLLKPYSARQIEIDANKWADENVKACKDILKLEVISGGKRKLPG